MKEERRDGLVTVGHCLWLAAGALAVAGCATEPDSRQLRLEGQRAMIRGDYAAARGLFQFAHEATPEDPANLHDLGDCCVYFARDQFARRNTAAALREVDRAIEYYQRSINAHPGFQPALLGKNIALELKGQFQEALEVAEWAAEFVGPSAQQQIFLARELEQRGDLDAALLRLRQAVAMEPDSAAAHEALGMFYLRIGKRPVAIRHLTASYRLDPSRPGPADALTELGSPLPIVPERAGGR
ncbi:MAG: tetratricopeptide repeat protein [Planctomycetota bacterium]|jgi:tetratricopeptide (TPR) repeat protein